jgi:hypothetical protein
VIFKKKKKRETKPEILVLNNNFELSKYLKPLRYIEVHGTPHEVRRLTDNKITAALVRQGKPSPTGRNTYDKASALKSFSKCASLSPRTQFRIAVTSVTQFRVQSMPHFMPSTDEVVAKVASLDPPAIFVFEAMPALKKLMDMEAGNVGVDPTQIFTNLLVAANGCCTRMCAKMQPKDAGYPNTCAVS